jgi:hypothetical protein
MIHDSLEIFYKPGRKRGPAPNKTIKGIYETWKHEHNQDRDLLLQEGDESYPAIDLMEEMMVNYVDEYGDDEDIRVIQPEMPFQVDVDDPDTGEYLFTYVGKMDAVVRHLVKNQVGLLEHKTGANFAPFGAPMVLDEQAGAYWTFGWLYLSAKGHIKEGQEFSFILYNRMRKAFRDVRNKNESGLFLNKDGTVSKRQPEPLFKREFVFRGPGDRLSVYNRAIQEAREIIKARKGKMPIYKNPGRHCSWCEFFDMCEVHESQGDWESIVSVTMGKWDPYEDHQVEVKG